MSSLVDCQLTPPALTPTPPPSSTLCLANERLRNWSTKCSDQKRRQCLWFYLIYAHSSESIPHCGRYQGIRIWAFVIRSGESPLDECICKFELIFVTVLGMNHVPRMGPFDEMPEVVSPQLYYLIKYFCLTASSPGFAPGLLTYYWHKKPSLYSQRGQAPRPVVTPWLWSVRPTCRGEFCSGALLWSPGSTFSKFPVVYGAVGSVARGRERENQEWVRTFWTTDSQITRGWQERRTKRQRMR